MSAALDPFHDLLRYNIKIWIGGVLTSAAHEGSGVLFPVYRRFFNTLHE